MPDDERAADRSPYLLVRALRSTVGRESTTFGFSILVTVTFGILQTTHHTPGVRQVYAFAVGAVLSFTLLEAVLSVGFRKPMPQHHTQTLALGTALNVVSVVAGLSAAWLVAELARGWWLWGLAPFAAGVVYLLLESVEAALAERILKHAGDRDADDVES